MPIMNGIESSKLIQNHCNEGSIKCPVLIVCSAQDSEDTYDDIFDDEIRKPIMV